MGSLNCTSDVASLAWIRCRLPLLHCPSRLSGLPAWVRPNGRDVTEADAAFAAGIALKSLDDLVPLEPVWAGCWRSRQALKCATAAVGIDGPNRGRTRVA
jgi:hypothetical protein